MKFNEVLVTPDIAVQYLTKNQNNRPLDRFHVLKLSKDIADGKWSMNGDTIRFNKDGELIDGQHRLNAVIKAGVPVPMIIVTDIEDPHAFRTIDTNSKLRNVGQVLGLMNVKNGFVAGAVARRLIHWETTEDKSTFSLDVANYRYVSTADIIQYVENNNEEIQYMVLKMKRSLIFKQCGAGTILVTSLIICSRYNEEEAEEFINALISGYHPQMDSPVIRLRDRLLTPPDRKGNKWELELMAIVFKAFRKFLDHQPIKQLRWVFEGNNKEPFPFLETEIDKQEVLELE